MKIGILELLCANACKRWDQTAFGFIVVKQYASIMPQAVSVWSRNEGHRVYYATYFQQKDPQKLLPDDLDIIFISTYTQASALAYALAKLYRQKKTLTIIGGPHAKQFPHDCLRFFDIVVRDCDHQLIKEILRDRPRGQILTSGRLLHSIPSVQERMPEIRSSAFLWGKPHPYTTISMLASTGCPNACDFCVDWNNPYRLMPLHQLETDLRFIFREFPNIMITFHDANFAIQFDQVIDILEKIPNRPRIRYIVETSLSLLQPSRLERLKKLGDFYLVTGIESWTDYSKKSGIESGTDSRQKLDKVVEQVKVMRPYFAGIQANFLFGLDTDKGNKPIELTKEFAARTPYVIPTFNIPVPFGQTPLFKRYLGENRILTSLPFTFYYMPYLAYKLKNYNTEEFYEKFVDLFSCLSSGKMLLKRMSSSSRPSIALFNVTKTFRYKQMQNKFHSILSLLKNDKQFRAFHERETNKLPEFYHYQYEQLLGPYTDLMSREEREPILEMP